MEHILSRLILCHLAKLFCPIANLQWFDLIGLQRHIKVLGIFARLWLRDGKAGYLNYLPLVLHYVMEVAARYPPAAEFVEWMQVRVLPACHRQSWWREIDQ